MATTQITDTTPHIDQKFNTIQTISTEHTTTTGMVIMEMADTIMDLDTMGMVMDITPLSTLTETQTHMPHLQETSTLTDITTTLQLAERL